MKILKRFQTRTTNRKIRKGYLQRFVAFGSTTPARCCGSMCSRRKRDTPGFCITWIILNKVFKTYYASYGMTVSYLICKFKDNLKQLVLAFYIQ